MRDVDCWSDKSVVLQVMATETGKTTDNFKVISLRKVHGGSQVAVMVLPPVAHKLAEKSRVHVRLVNCRVRLGEKRIRYFKCLAMGHLSKDCADPDQTQCSRRCGTTGHRVVHCITKQKTETEFNEMLVKEGALCFDPSKTG